MYYYSCIRTNVPVVLVPEDNYKTELQSTTLKYFEVRKVTVRMPVQLYQDISTRMYPQPACRKLQLNLEIVYALVVLSIYWEDNIWKVLLKI